MHSTKVQQAVCGDSRLAGAPDERADGRGHASVRRRLVSNPRPHDPNYRVGDRRGTTGNHPVPVTPQEIRFRKWDKATEWPMTFLSIIFLVLYSYQVLGRPAGRARVLVDVAENSLWALFAVDYVITFVLAPRKRHWFVTHLFDLLVVLLPFARPLRIIFAFAPLRVLHHARSSTSFRLTVFAYALAISSLVLYVGPLAMLEAERGARGSTINTFGEALWWTMTTITAVGYGDYAPVTNRGRVIAVLLMFSGVALVGVISAILSSWIIDEENVRKDLENRLMRERVEKLSGRLARIDENLAALSAAAGVPSPAGAATAHAASATSARSKTGRTTVGQWAAGHPSSGHPAVEQSPGSHPVSAGFSSGGQHPVRQQAVPPHVRREGA